MSLQNLVGISLERITPAKQTIKRLLDGAARHIADAKIQAVSGETRFGSAYTAIRMLADIGLHAHGYRTLTSKPGHHQTAIQTLPTTLGTDSQTVIRLDKLRKQRSLTEYTGDLIPESAVKECLSQAESLFVGGDGETRIFEGEKRIWRKSSGGRRHGVGIQVWHAQDSGARWCSFDRFPALVVGMCSPDASLRLGWPALQDGAYPNASIGRVCATTKPLEDLLT